MNRRSLFKSLLFAPAAAVALEAPVVAALRSQAPLLATIASSKRIDPPAEFPKPVPVTDPVDWDRIALDAVYLLDRRLGMICRKSALEFAVNDPRIGYTFHLEGPVRRLVKIDSLYGDDTEALSDLVVGGMNHSGVFNQFIVPMIDKIARQIFEDSDRAQDPATFVSVVLEKPNGIDQAITAVAHDRLALRICRSRIAIECREQGAECEMMYSFSRNEMTPVEKPFTYFTRIDVLGGFARRVAA